MREHIPLGVLLIACVAALLSVGYSFYYHDRPRVDALGYDEIGWNLARGLGYVEDETLAMTPEKDWGINRVGPGYQFFLASLYIFFGHHYWIVWIAHALLRAVSVVLVYVIARLFFSGESQAPLGAAVLFALSPDLIVVNGLLLTETLFLFMFLAALYTSSQIVKGSKKSYEVLLAGFLWAFAILIRPTALLPWLLITGILAWQRRWRGLAPFVAAVVLLVGSWSLFASLRYDRFILTTGVGGYDLWVGNNIGARGGFVKTPEVQAVRNTVADSKTLDEIAKRNYVMFLTAHPFRFIELQFRKAALYFSLLRPGGSAIHLWSYPWHRLITILLSFVWTAMLFIGGLAGALSLYYSRKDILSRSFLAILLLQPLSVIPVIVETRYRYPLFPFLAILAAHFFMQRPLLKKFLIASVAFFFVFSFYDAVSNAHEFQSAFGALIRSLKTPP